MSGFLNRELGNSGMNDEVTLTEEMIAWAACVHVAHNDPRVPFSVNVNIDEE